MKKSGNSGFSLIELMVVVGIIGILASLAIPRFQEFQARARQSEAKANLNYMATLQEAFYSEMNTYLAALAITPAACPIPNNTLGFSPTPCNKLSYTYNVAAGNTTSWMGNAMEFGGRVWMCANATYDSWTIDQTRAITDANAGLGC